MDVDVSRLRVQVSEQCLDIFYVNAVLIKVSGKTVTAAMTGNMPGNTCPGCTFLEEIIDAILAKIRPGPGTGEKNASGLAAL